MTFKELKISEPVLRALAEKGYTKPTPIQEQGIPVVLNNKDLLGCAQTGTGKTAVFAIPIIQHLAQQTNFGKKREIKALVLTPTRELAIQISDSFKDYSKHTSVAHGLVFGGVNQQPQTVMLKKGVDVLIATPGRLLDLINQGFIKLNAITHFVLDEADHMLDMGFIHDINRILPLLPKEKQTMFFSATMPASIAALAKSLLRNPVRISIEPKKPVIDTIDQYVYYIDQEGKKDLLLHLVKQAKSKSILVFSRTKHGSDRIARILCKAGIGSDSIHSNKSQAARQRALADFKSGKIRVMIATDIASRGIDIQELPMVINYDLPNVPEIYVHRIGRTGRAGHAGTALSLCAKNEMGLLKDIQKTIGFTIPVVR
ncbi:MAG: DEAD/DEAH box helicase [Bacteroidales bacterium]|jgi:ATP-dependent RNA helicase RhlE|nr:DEAD/DEAH box helicase [Bacteroidales bacterium]